MRVLFILIGVILCGPTYGSTAIDPYDQIVAEEHETFVDCETLETDGLPCGRLVTARRLARQASLRTFDRFEGRVVTPYREFVLIAYDPETDGFHDIRLGMPVNVAKQPNFQPIVLTQSDVPYTVKRLRGQSLNKMVFEVRQGNRMLFAYAAKHLLFTEEKLHSFWGGRTVELVEEVVYLATPPYLVSDEFARAGQALFMQRLEQAFSDLRQSEVPSLAYPGQLLADMVTVDEVAHLILAEQTDPCFLEKRPKGCQSVIPVRPYSSDAEVMQAVNTEFVMNGLAAFSHMRSSASARGVLQFTDNRSKRYMGTYSTALLSCPRAKLDPDFRRGARSLLNMTKAAACLIDLELSNKRLPDWVREAFRRDRDFGRTIPGAAYNGGASQASVMAALIDSFAKRQGIGKEDLLFDLFPWDIFLRWIDQSGTKLKPETRGYVEKIIHIRDHLRSHRPKLPVVNFEGNLG